MLDPAFTVTVDWEGGGGGGVGLHTFQGRREAFCSSVVSHMNCCIRESVDSLCRDGADAQYMQYLSKSRITSPQTR